MDVAQYSCLDRYLDTNDNRPINTNERRSIRIFSQSLPNLSAYRSEPFDSPMHMHGHAFQVLAHVNDTKWNGTITNSHNPLRRDTQVVGPLSTIVLQIEANNAGIWPLHCHIAWHVSLGLYVQFIEQTDTIKKLGVEKYTDGTCKSWNDWEKTHDMEQIDSGLRMMSVRIGGVDSMSKA
jgi:hypothetical protein